MHVHAAAFREIARITGVSTLPAADAQAVMSIARLVAGADDREDAEELALLGELATHLGGVANTLVGIPDIFANDDYERFEKIREVGGRLSTTQSRELAYALAYVVTVSDLELAPGETEFLADLAVAVGISDARADDLAAQVAAAITPPA